MNEENTEKEKSRNRNVTILNKSSVKKFALRCSKEFKNGKFTRVSKGFLDDTEAELERIIRSVAGTGPLTSLSRDELCNEDTCPELITGKALRKVSGQLNFALARYIQRRVSNQPSFGKTL